MRTQWILTLALVLFVAACGGAGDKAEHAADHSHGDGDHDHSHAQVADFNPAEGEVLLSGTLGCGHCTYKKGDGCSAAIQTADGKIYILDNITQDTEAFQKRFGGKDLKVVGSVVDAGDPSHLEVRAHEFL